jgi:hypothetical protein
MPAAQQRLFSYVLRYDDGAAPNPFWGTCTLTICKPDIRRTATNGDWIVGTGSKNSTLKDGKRYDFSDSVVYAMKITNKMSLADYDTFARGHLPRKMPKWNSRDFRRRMGDCLYDYSVNTESPRQRDGVHPDNHMPKDLRGKNSLLSKHFYYFGEEPRPLPTNLKKIIRRGQKHLVFHDRLLIETFEQWISQFDKNRLYADPQLRYAFDLNWGKSKPSCATVSGKNC